MVTVKCNKHGEHLMKPLDLAVVVEEYGQIIVSLAYALPFPEVQGISDRAAMRKVICPQETLDEVKSRRDGQNSVRSLLRKTVRDSRGIRDK